MDIFDILRDDHARVRNLLNELILQTSEPTADHDAHLEPLNALKRAMIAHDRAEESVLYEHLRINAHQADLAESKAEEHHLAEAILIELERKSPTDADWDMSLGLLKNQIESHMAEEETSTFDMLRPFVDAEATERMADEFLEMQAQVSGEELQKMQRQMHSGLGAESDRPHQ